ncbi:General aromatic amino acid permease [Actinomyces bovis]|uniref:General aromatic amino acid permease n=1 Tax=Actinomyces bovis TaxID=1658 RepID=A0ABY1VRE8_9ACTO|nr:amino acid permease [Actinomyces bovis]SPT54257.1 General aromatic amino acid permease [Actinomyces bovis]VEG56440.1 General aromatic amino acid permease [Actinomyces israelii]
MSQQTPPTPSGHVDRADSGYDKALKRRHLQMIAIGGSIGTGLFLGAGGRLADGGPGLALAYAVCGVFAFLMVRALGELAIRRPSSGAFVSYAREFLGEKGAYVTGWMFFLDWSVTVMADITAVAVYLHYWKGLQGVPQWVFALLALALVFVLNMMNVKMFGEAEFWFAAIKVTAIVAFMLIAIWAIVTGATVGESTTGLHNISDNGGLFPKGLAPVFALTLGVIFAFGGTEMVGVAAGEAKDAVAVLPKAINSMILRIFIFYVGSVALMTLVLPYTAYSKNESPFVTFFSGIGIPHAGDIIQVVVLTAALSSLNAGLYATGRTLRSMAIAGEAPRLAAGLNKHHVPAGAIAITSILGLLGVVLNAFLAEDAFEIVMNLAGIGIAGTWAAILVTHLVFLKRVKEGRETRPAYRMPGAPYTNYAALLFFGVVVLSNLTSTSGRWTLALFALVVVMMVAGWYAVRGRIRSDLLDDLLSEEPSPQG